MTATARLVADEVLDLSLWADQPDAVHPNATAAEAAAVADANWLVGQVVYVRNAGGGGDEHALVPPVAPASTTWTPSTGPTTRREPVWTPTWTSCFSTP